MVSGYLAGWTSPFAWGVGALTLACAALLAAVYLAADLDDDAELQAAFRRRAMICEVITGACALVVALLAARDSPRLWDALLAGPWALGVHVAAFAAATTTLWALLTRRFALARVTVGLQVAAVVVGWGVASGDDLVLGAVPLYAAGVVPHVVEPVLWTLAASGVVLVPALFWLLRVFKSRRASTDEPAPEA
ncbi:MAG: cytochrome d ubiquinol oxidase subunit II [Myxococcales bacterium]|nr:cytochrome d ubiquinol oxidase subunit II [Myxococcales bacterium]